MLDTIVLVSLSLLALIAAATLRSTKTRTWALAVISYLFYIFAGGSWLVGLLLVSTAVNYLVGLRLRKTESRGVLIAGVLFNLALLGSFKYLPPIAANLPSWSSFARLALPLGISFWTFQAMSYLFDQYRGEDLDPSFLEFALYMSFFPVVISGPICRMPDMLPQFRKERPSRWDHIGRGLARIATGVLMMQLAKLLGQGILSGDGIVSGFDLTMRWGGTDVWCLAIGFGLQLFFDFAGYSHIAIGAAQALGFTVPENFNRPFSSTTPSIFWTRWHMSLSFWIRDYLFLPLAMLRRELWWRNLMLVVSMVVFGLWHKATILFVLWGCYHGVLLLLHRQIERAQRTFNWEPPELLWNPLSWIVTMALISMGWVLFRANSLPQARQMLGAVLSPGTYSTHWLSGSLYGLVGALGIGYALVVVITNKIDAAASQPSTNRVLEWATRSRWYWIPALYALLLIFVLMVTSTQSGGVGQLMYRRF